MKILTQTRVTKNDLLIIPFYTGKNPKSTQKEAIENRHHADFEGKENESVMLYQKDKITPRILLVGLGEQQKETTESWRNAGGTAAKHIKKAMQTVAFIPPIENLELMGAFIEGFLLAQYKFEAFITDPKRKQHTIKQLNVIITNKKSTPALIQKFEEIQTLTDSIKLVRDLVNSPANEMSPKQLGKHAQKIAAKSRNIKCQVIDEKKLEKMGMNCLVGVGKGADENTKLIVLEYKYKPTNKKPIAFVGKGICFDSGGIHLKTRNLVEMKYDMTGAATVLGLFNVLSELNLPLHIIGVAACAENLVGANANKPGDIQTAYDGTTVEITNTDAEGRLVLCDALAYTVKTYKPESIIDIATLTGAASVALGHDITALMTNDEKLGNEIKAASKQTHEKTWELPLDQDYKKFVKSEIADVRNYSREASAGTIMAALFLEHFVKDTPWVHLDIGGTAWAETQKPYCPKGATGALIRTLWQFLKSK
jgi:leucyl aminopeptidase